MTTGVLLQQSLAEHARLFSSLACGEDVLTVAELLSSVLQRRGKVLIAGNGGSAADAQHFAAEMVGYFQRTRAALPCIALTTDTSSLTAIGNDVGFEQIFARQVEALGQPGDVFLGISTSGNSPNIIEALRVAQHRGLHTVALLGRCGGAMRTLADHAVVVPGSVTARIQEAHIFFLHFWADCIERSLSAC